jgi:hypothetical protein
MYVCVCVFYLRHMNTAATYVCMCVCVLLAAHEYRSDLCVGVCVRMCILYVYVCVYLYVGMYVHNVQCTPSFGGHEFIWRTRIHLEDTNSFGGH